MAVKRIWRGWTLKAKANAYQQLLHDEVFPGIAKKNIPGYQSIELLRRELGKEVEFMTIMTFDSLQNVIDFQGADYAKAYVPEAAQQLLHRWDQESSHFDTISFISY